MARLVKHEDVFRRFFRDFGSTSTLAGISAASRFSAKIQAFFEEYLVTEEGPTVPFGGRDSEIDLLDAWLEDVDGSTRFVLAAPAGRGKSALLVRWIKRLESTGRIGQPDTWQLAFVPISLRFNTNRPQVFYEALAARLSNILGQALNAAQTDPVAYYQDKCRELVTELFQTKKLVLIVIDGLDEAMGDAFDASWFPRGVGASIRLLVSARTQFDASDARGWIERLGWY